MICAQCHDAEASDAEGWPVTLLCGFCRGLCAQRAKANPLKPPEPNPVIQYAAGQLLRSIATIDRLHDAFSRDALAAQRRSGFAVIDGGRDAIGN